MNLSLHSRALRIFLFLLFATTSRAGQGYDLSHVDGIESFGGSARAQELLATNGFVVGAPSFRQIFEPYINSPLPVLITADSAWHTYHFLLEHGIKEMETSQSAKLASFSRLLMNAARERNRGGVPEFGELEKFAAVGLAFQEPTAVTNLNQEQKEILKGLISGEAPVRAHIGFDLSPVTFRPQSFYTQTPELSAYYRARTWYASIDFRLSDDRETRLALCLAWLVHSRPELTKLWSELTSPYDGFVAPADDATVSDYFGNATAVLGTNFTLENLQQRTKEVTAKLRTQPKLPRVNDQLLDPEAYAHFAQVTAGFRLLPARQLPCAVCLQNCVEPRIKGRLCPSGLDFFTASAVLRSPAALRAARNQFGEAVVAGILKADPGPMPDSLYGESMMLLKTLQAPLPSSVPAAFRSEAWADMKLGTQLGAWAEQRHTWALHAKPAVEFMGMAETPPGIVEPYPHFFAGLARLCRETSIALGTNRDSQPSIPQALTNLASVCERLTVLAEKELGGKTATEEEARWISDYGITLAGLHFYQGNSWLEPEDDFSILSRVFAIPVNGSVLYAAVSRPQALYVVLPYKDRMQLYRGSVLSYREFERNENENLSDESWQAMVRQAEVPPAPPFTGTFQQADSPDAQQSNRLSYIIFAGQDLAKPPPLSPISLNVKQTLLARISAVAHDRVDGERMMSSDDERHVILVEESAGKQRLVRDGVPEKEHDAVLLEWFSPDSRHVVYAAVDNGRYCVVKDGVPGKSYAKIEPLRHEVQFVFSSNSLHMAYEATPAPGQKCVVVDDMENSVYEEILEGSFSFSAGSGHYCYAARRGTKGFVVKDNRVAVECDADGWNHVRQGPYLSPDGERLACFAKRGSQWFASIDGKDSHPWKSIGNSWQAGLSPDGRHFSYDGQDERGFIVVVDEQEFPDCGITPAAFSPNGKSWAIIHEDDAGSWVIVNGKRGKTYQGTILAPTFSPDGNRLGYLVESHSGSGPMAVIHEEQDFENTQPELWQGIRFSPDSKHFSISGIRGRKPVVIIDGKQYPAADIGEGGTEVLFSPNSERWAYLAFHGGRVYWVVSGVEYGPYGTISANAFHSDAPVLNYNVANFYFSPDSRHFAFRATREGRHLLVVDGLEREFTEDWFPHSSIVFDSATAFHFIVRDKNEIHLVEANIESK